MSHTRTVWSRDADTTRSSCAEALHQVVWFGSVYFGLVWLGLLWFGLV